MIDFIAGPNNIHLGIFGVTYALIGILILTFIILPQALSEAKENDGIRNIRLSLPALVMVIILSFGFALVTTLGPLLDGRFGSAVANFSRFYYGSGVGTLGILLFIIYKKGGEPIPPPKE